MRAMIPHHSLAITRSERFDVDDYRVCELAVEISEAQRREIDEMDWLIEDIQENGPASTRAEADARPVPAFEGNASRQCDAGCSDVRAPGCLARHRRSPDLPYPPDRKSTRLNS